MKDLQSGMISGALSTARSEMSMRGIACPMRVWGLGVWGLGFRVGAWGLGFRGRVSGFRVWSYLLEGSLLQILRRGVVGTCGEFSHRQLNTFERLLPESQGQHVALSVLCVPSPLGSGEALVGYRGGKRIFLIRVRIQMYAPVASNVYRASARDGSWRQ